MNSYLFPYDESHYLHDHCVSKGADIVLVRVNAQFMQALAGYLENPVAMLLQKNFRSL